MRVATKHLHEIEITSANHGLTTRWEVKDGRITDHRAMHSYFEYSLEDAKQLRDWLTERIECLEYAS